MKFRNITQNIIIGVVVFCTVLSSYGNTDNGAAKELLKEGTELFRQANELAATDMDKSRELYGKAIMRFEKIVNDYGIENGKLYYNIGNTYFKMEDIGSAILNYRRAERLIPSDMNLIRNLHYAQAKRIDSFEERQTTRVLKTLFFWHYDFSSRARSLFFGFSFSLVWGLGIVRLFKRNTLLNWLIGIFAIISLFVFSSLTIDYMKEKLVKPGVIIAREVVARKGDSKTYEPAFKKPLHAGTEFVLKEDRGDWIRAELTDGALCWLPKDSVGMVNSPD